MDAKENTRELVVVDVKRYKKVKSALKESEERYRQLFENVPIGIYRTTPEGRIVDANPALVKMLGYASFAELSSRNLEKEYSHAGYLRSDFIKRLKRDGEIIGLEAIWSRKDGSPIHVRENAKLTRTEEGQVLFEGTVEDITLSKQAEAAQKIRSQQLEILNRIICSGNLAESMAGMLEKILDTVIELLAFDSGGIYKYDPEAGKVNLLARRGKPSRFYLFEKYMAIDKMPFSQVLLKGQPVFVDHLRKALPDLARKWGWQMACSIPLVSKGRVVGAMNMASSSRAAFTPEEKNMLELIGKEAGTLMSKLQTETDLRESEKYYRTLIDTSPDIVAVMDLDARLLTVNQQFLKSGGYFYDEVIGVKAYDFVSGIDHVFLKKKTSAFIKKMNISGSEYLFKKKDGQVIPLEVAASLLNDGQGRPKGIIAIGRDVSERKRAEEALRVAETRYRLLFEQSPDGIVIIDPATARLLEFNETAHRQLGYSREEFARLSIHDIETVESPEETRSHIAQVMKDGLGDFETRQRTRQGEIRNIQVTAQFTKMLDRPIYHCIWRDITVRKEAEAKLLAYQEQLRALTSERTLIEERERRRIASELHDQIGQNLALCKLKIAALEKNLADDAMKSEMAAVRRLLECSIQDARSLIFDLSPPVLYELGIAAALEWLAERIQEQFHVPVEFESRFAGSELDSDRQVILFQVVRELLVNVGKHSRASQAKVILSHEEPFLKIQVNDDGVGFDPSRVFVANGASGGFGFFSMRERLNYLGGRLDIKSRAGRGSQIIVTVPQQRSAAAR